MGKGANMQIGEYAGVRILAIQSSLSKSMFQSIGKGSPGAFLSALILAAQPSLNKSKIQIIGKGSPEAFANSPICIFAH